MDFIANCLIFLFFSWPILLAQSPYPYSECKNDETLGMISGEIKDLQITASTISSTRNCQEWRGRLYRRNKRSWCPKYNSSSEWLQVDLGVPTQVTGVMTQGRADGNQYVKEFKLSYSTDGSVFHYVKDSLDNQKIFEGNSDSFSVKHNYMDEPLQARFIKFHVHKWQGYPSLRVEILGCQACKHILGIPPYARFTASSYRGKRKRKTCTADYGHLFSNKAWCSKFQNNQWLQIDIGPPTLITGLITKGRGDGRKKYWVKKYKVSYSTDGRSFKFYKHASYMDPKTSQGSTISYKYRTKIIENFTIFEGNSDKNTEQVHYLYAPFIARFIRFHPIESEGMVAMRVGLYGCPHVGDCGPGFFRINNQSSCVTNLAYKKSAGIDFGGNRHSKRHLRVNRKFDGEDSAQLAVDGGLQGCTLLENRTPYNVAPTWFVDMSELNLISGVIIHLSKETSKLQQGVTKSLLDNLDELEVYVKKWHITESYHRGRNIRELCGRVYELGRVYQLSSDKSKIHIPCKQPITGRYVYVKANGIKNSWSKKFAALLCEVLIY